VSECWYCCKHEFYAATSFVGLVMMQTTMNLLCKHDFYAATSFVGTLNLFGSELLKMMDNSHIIISRVPLQLILQCHNYNET
jgi:hypothetical protein